MQRTSTVSQFVRVFVTAAALVGGTMGCGSNNQTGGGGGAPCTLDQVQAIFTTGSTNVSTGCTVIGSCHDNMGTAAGLDLTAGSGWQTKLVGTGPMAGKGTIASMCTGKNLVYLQAGSKPAAGLLIDKLNPANPTPPCGVHMPNLGVMLSASDFACVQSYATTLTSM